MTMTLGQLRAMVAAEPESNDKLPVKIWLPGSTISIGDAPLGGISINFIRRGSELLIEGNVDPGSVLR